VDNFFRCSAVRLRRRFGSAGRPRLLRPVGSELLCSGPKLLCFGPELLPQGEMQEGS